MCLFIWWFYEYMHIYLFLFLFCLRPNVKLIMIGYTFLWQALHLGHKGKLSWLQRWHLIWSWQQPIKPWCLVVILNVIFQITLWKGKKITLLFLVHVGIMEICDSKYSHQLSIWQMCNILNKWLTKLVALVVGAF